MTRLRALTAIAALIAIGGCGDQGIVGPTITARPTLQSKAVTTSSGVICGINETFTLTLFYDNAYWTHIYTVTSRNGNQIEGVGTFDGADPSLSERFTGTFDGTELSIQSEYLKNGARHTWSEAPNGYDLTITGTVNGTGDFTGGGSSSIGQVFQPGTIAGTSVATCMSCSLKNDFVLTIFHDNQNWTHTYTITSRNGNNIEGVGRYVGWDDPNLSERFTGTFDGTNLRLTSEYLRSGARYVGPEAPSGYDLNYIGTVDASGAFTGTGYSQYHTFGDETITGSDLLGCPEADTEPPTISVPSEILAEATAPVGAQVDFAPHVTVVDNSGVVSTTCTHVSGSYFPLGATAVICTATDPAGNSSTGSFTIRVFDTQAPNLAVSGNIVVDATSPSGAAVSYVVNATDVVGVEALGCSPDPGNFPVAITTVTCTAADAAGNTASGAFTVTVKSASTQIDDLRHAVAGLDLAEGIETSLDAKLTNALQSLSSNDLASACGSLNAAINQISAQSGKKISVQDAEALIARVTRIHAAAGC
jgi:hypothetical protein